jgi:hypothetical protein
VHHSAREYVSTVANRLSHCEYAVASAHHIYHERSQLETNSRAYFDPPFSLSVRLKGFDHISSQSDFGSGFDMHRVYCV